MSNTRGLVYVVDDDVSVREGVASGVETNCELSGLAK
jgi:FixJ family two-component response regulator